MKNIISVFVILFLSLSCSFFKNGFIDENGQYRPKKLRFQLKDKVGAYPNGLDTVGVYRMTKMYNDGILVYPSEFSKHEEFNSGIPFIKFYGKGRCGLFTVSKTDSSEVSTFVNKEDLDPNNENYNKCYYYSGDGKSIQVESFVKGDGKGHYVIMKYTLKDFGNKLRFKNEYIEMIYERQAIPANWNMYNVDW